jgi:hypothetical protein
MSSKHQSGAPKIKSRAKQKLLQRRKISHDANPQQRVTSGSRKMKDPCSRDGARQKKRKLLGDARKQEN